MRAHRGGGPGAVARGDRGGDLLVPGEGVVRALGAVPQVDRVRAGFALPTGGLPEELQPILEIIPLQMLAYEVTIARGQDPDAPRALAEITETR